VSIVVAHKDDVLQIKNAALRFRPADAAQTANPATAGRPASARDGGIGGSREPRSQRTVYVLQFDRPQPVQIKTGISDGVSTEVNEGLKEGDQVIIAELAPASASSGSPPANPFSGGRRFP